MNLGALLADLASLAGRSICRRCFSSRLVWQLGRAGIPPIHAWICTVPMVKSEITGHNEFLMEVQSR